ncbi:hypothetical protein Agub_g11389, partial [Astrephomene gubernaculifera]
MSSLACAEATCLWLTENYTDCYATLQKVESESKADPKLAHNLLVVEHVVAGRTDSERIAAQLELLANERLSADDGGSSGTSGNTAADAGPSAGSSTSGFRSRSSGTLEVLPLVPVRDDLAVAQLNRALLLLRAHRPALAADLLERLAADVEALPEGTAVRLLAALLDALIEIRQLPRAVAALQTLERMYGSLMEAYGSGSGGGGAGGGGEGGGRPAVLALPRVSRWDSGPMMRCRALLEQQGRPPACPDLKLLIRLYRSRLHALAHNTRAAKRELKAVIAALHLTPLQQQQLLAGGGSPSSGPGGQPSSDTAAAVPAATANGLPPRHASAAACSTSTSPTAATITTTADAA